MDRLGVGFTEELSFARVSYFPEKGVLHTHLFAGSEIDHAMSMQTLEIAIRLTGGQKYRSLVTMEDNVSLTSEARAVGASEQSTRPLIAQAIVVSSLATRLLGNFFIRFNKPPNPTRIFSNTNDALDWLLDSN
jgi:hypothetical protein